MPDTDLLGPVLDCVFDAPLERSLPLLGLMLQQTDAFNFSIMNALIKIEAKLINQVIQKRDLKLLIGFIRCFEAQPNLKSLIDLASIFQEQPVDSEDQFNLLWWHLQKLVTPERNDQETDQHRETRKALVNSLMLNKQELLISKEKEIRLLRQKVESSFAEIGDENKPCTVTGGIVQTAYLDDKVNKIMAQIERQPYGNFAVCGPQASGKISIVKLVMQLYNERYNQNQQMIVVTCEETFDSKNLVGTYVCSETGEFVFKKGPLTVAAEQGLWLVLKNVEDTPSDLLSFLLPLIEQKRLQVTSTFTIVPKLGFRIFCLANYDNGPGRNEDIQPLLSSLHITQLSTLYRPGSESRQDFDDILMAKFPELFIPVGIISIHQLVQDAIQFIHQAMQSLKLNLLDYKAPSVTNLLALYKRLHLAFTAAITDKQTVFSQAQRQLIVEEISDVYLGYLYDISIKRRIIDGMVKEIFNKDESNSTLDSVIISEFITNAGREYGVSDQMCFFGRASLKRADQRPDQKDVQSSNKFVYTGSTVRQLEQVANAISNDEPILLVGETGTGKTTLVQEVAQTLGKTLHVFNMNQNTDSADLLGGFKPVDLKYLLTPIYGRFRELFCSLLNASTQNNQTFLDLLQKCYESNKINDFIKCLQHGMKSIKAKHTLDPNVGHLDAQIRDLQKRAQKLESGGGFVFQFVEGTLIKSIQNGDWILLDEINLAPDSVLNRLATIILGNNIMLNERADIIETQKNPDFRVFMCMNPPYTSAGKKQLPYALRSRLCEIYVPELDNQEDLWQIIDRNTKSNAGLHATNYLNETQKRMILEFYMQVKQQVQKQTKRGNIGLRNLCRALFFIKSAIALNYPVVKAIYDSLYTCFASHLDEQLQAFVKGLIMKLFTIKTVPTLQKTLKGEANTSFTFLEDCIVKLGSHKPENFCEKNFILTKTFKGLLRQLASVVSVSSFAIILEGPTSAGKTSCVQYLAAVTHNKVIRINNHMHTDVQEYLGSYIPDALTGKLTFQEGVLVEAVRKGYWVILDELNLAPSEVLEALNRLLDDNRELHIVETQKTIKAHPNFRIFATQNPTEGYGGRKELSEAFKNRFVLIRVGDVPIDELQEILIQKCSLPASRASLMVKVMENLQIFRSQSNLFSGKNSIITVRDLLKWAGRINSSDEGNHVLPENVALEGYLLLAERSRNAIDKDHIKQTIEKVFGVKIDEDKFYSQYFDRHLSTVFQNVPAELNLPKLIMSRQLIRLAVLVAKCLKNKEPVLLVGETGCGKTTLCQVFASEVTKQPLFSINCHQNTETSDFIGCMRTRKNLQKTQDELYALTLTFKKVLGIEEQLSFDSHSLKRRARTIMAALKPSSNHDHISASQEIKRLLEDLNCVFEWHDGILVESMQQGGLLLIDEISLANDSVLERLNSVFEEGRTLVVTEKSSQEAVKIQAQPAFNMVATMNPSGDFGKKELSPALRNRMTEIWVDSYFHQKELIELFGQSFGVVREGTTLSQIDLYLIINQLSEGLQKSVTLGIFNMVGFVTFVLADKYFALHRKSMSIRDILNMVTFIKKSSLSVADAFRHAVELVIIDGICLGIDVAGNQETQAILQDCRVFLNRLISDLFGGDSNQNNDEFVNTKQKIGVGPFTISKNEAQARVSNFAFQASTTKSNLMKLLRAFSLNKPILIEGPPGVGKTALVENLARETGRTLVRVNLSEQTDMMDLLGSEYPVSRTMADSDAQDDDEIQFRWSDGVLLQAIKEGHWLLIDEMNLAQQSILEGLNAILDHRRTVYIPELNKEFVCHPDFFVFACQNPSQSVSSTTGRKTLPKSFLNRFIKIYLDDLTNDDFEMILEHIASDLFQTKTNVRNLLAATQQIETITKSQSQSTVNMRDISRFLKLLRNFNSNSEDTQASIVQALQSCYFTRQPLMSNCSLSLAIEHGLVSNDPEGLRIKTPIVRTLQDGSISFQGLTKTIVNRVESHAPQNLGSFKQFIDLKGKLAQKIQTLCDCLQCNIPLLITTDDPSRVIKTLNLLASASGQRLARILLSEKSDTTQLLGCFEQTSTDISSFIQLLQELKSQPNLTMPILELEAAFRNCKETASNDGYKLKLKLIEQTLVNYKDDFGAHFAQLHQRLKDFKQGSSRFQWVDSVLVQQIEHGGWAVFENANLCNPSILDRLNSLLEEGNYQLSINEQGLVYGDQIRNVKAHRQFRAIFVISERTLLEQGKDVSRALRNRCQEIWLRFADETIEEFGDQIVGANNLRDGSFDWQLKWLQADHDLVPLKLSVDAERTKCDAPMLGKRSRDSEERFVGDSQKQEALQIDQAIAYVFALLNFLTKSGHSSDLQLNKISQLLDHPDYQQLQSELKAIFTSSDQAGFDAFLRYQIRQLQQKLKFSLDHQIVDANIARILRPFADQPSTQPRDFLILLRGLLVGQLRMTFTQPHSLYMLSHLEVNHSALKTMLETVDSELAFLASSQSLNTLRHLTNLKPNYLTPQLVKLCLKDQDIKSTLLDEQSIYIYKAPRLELIEQKHMSRVSLSLIQLKSGNTVILLDKDKEILTEQKMIEQLEMIPDQAQLLELPNLLIIPKTEAKIVISQSYMYESLCFLKEYRWLQKGNQMPTNIRLSKLPSVTSYGTDLNAFGSLIARKISVNQLEQAYSPEGFNFARQTIASILQDEQSICLRDLPSFYACAASILYKLKSHGPDHIDQKFMAEFQRLAAETLGDQTTPSPLAIALDSKIDAWQTASDIENAQAVCQLAKQAVQKLETAFALLKKTHTVEMIQALFILPLETQRQTQLAELANQELLSQFTFFNYQLRDSEEANKLTLHEQKQLASIRQNLSQLHQLQAERVDEGVAVLMQKQLKPVLSFVMSIQGELSHLYALLEQFDASETHVNQVASISRNIGQLMLKGLEAFYPIFNHILEGLLASTCVAEESARQFVLMCFRLKTASQDLALPLINLQSSFQKSLAEQHCKLTKKSQHRNLYERQLLWTVKFVRGSDQIEKHQKVRSEAFDYFVRREVIKKMKEEERDPDEQIFFVPFKVKDQIPHVVGKAMDEWTKEDVAKMEAEAEKAIEDNFPSYYDEVQRTFFASEYQKEGARLVAKEKQETFSKITDDREITLQEVLQEILEVYQCEGSKGSILKERLQLASLVLDYDGVEAAKHKLNFSYLGDPMRQLQQGMTWQEDACSYIQHQLDQTVRLKQIMNVSDVNLARNYNFYHSPFPEEIKLVLPPIQALLMRLRDIVIRDQYENPLLNESMFLANYMITCFNAEHTPLMKILMSIEFLLSKLEEWENTYASKRLNSVETEINTLKQIVIRLRKIQILSWRNLLNWKKEQFVKEDFMNFVRLAHTLERQVFDKKMYKTSKTEQSVELKMFELLDLFMRDSSLGVFSGRLQLIKFLLQHFSLKLNTQYSAIHNQQVKLRLTQLVNALDFVYNYYGQFLGKLQQTVDRLDGNAREKVKTLIDVRKWTVQKFSIIKNNIDKTHKQLYRACKDEEEALLQNVQQLVIASQRKKYANNDQMMNLDPELKSEPVMSTTTSAVPIDLLNQFTFIKSLQFLEETKVWRGWPSAGVFEDAMAGFFERLADVRAINKKHIQKRAYYDLLRYFKDQGIRSTISEDVQSLLIATKIVASQQGPNYFFKSYEAFLMLSNSSQVDGNSDFENTEIRRVQGFSQNLIFKVLQQNKAVSEIQTKVERLRQAFHASLLEPQNHDNYLTLGRDELVRSIKVKDEVSSCVAQTLEKLNIQVFAATDAERVAQIKLAIQTLKSVKVPASPFEAGFIAKLSFIVLSVSGALETLKSSTVASERDQIICSFALAEFVKLEISIVTLQTSHEPEPEEAQIKRLSKCEKEVKLVYQDILKCLASAEDQKFAGTRKSSLEVDTTNPTVIDQPERLELTMDQHVKFTKSLQENVLGQRFEKLLETVNQIYTLSGNTHASGSALQYTTALLAQVLSCLQKLCSSQSEVLHRMAKFSYLTQRVFLYLIYQGFCGIEEPDDPEEQPPSDLEQEDGCGMGDGQGGAQNITEQIEHEEQLEGLKNYESEEDKPEEQDVSHGEDDNDFEMKNDFDGKMDDERDEEEKHDEKNEEDERDNVDDLLDNQLWDKNMEDMEKKQEEEMEQQQDNERQEIDLGEREIDKQNQVDNKKQDVAEGDFDEKEQDSEQANDQPEDKEMAEAEDEGGERHESDAEGDEESGNENVPLDKDSVKAEPEEEFSDDAVSESEIQSDAEQKSSPDQSEGEGLEGSEKEDLDGDQQSQDDLEVQAECNQAVLEDDQIQAKEDQKNKDDKRPNTQANLKKQEASNKEKSEAQRQDKPQDNQSSSQVDPNGADMLYQLTQKLQQRQQQKQAQQQQPQKQQEESKKTIDQPNLTDQHMDAQDESMAEDGEAMEYEQDENAQELQGKLCTDQVQENAQVAEDQDMDDPNPQMESDNEQIELNQKAEMTGAQVKQVEMAKAEAGLKPDKPTDQQMEESKEEQLRDLISDYTQYLTDKKDMQMEIEERQFQPDQAKASNFVQDLEPFDILAQKARIRELLALWCQDEHLHKTSLELLAKFKNQTQHVQASLCEQLRIILEPQLSQNLQGDYKTGKRLNMKKVISFIASHYRNDKIWLRRTLPSKRDYKILIAIDDTLSMKENNLGFFSLEAMIALTEALNKLEVGKVAVARIRDRMDLLHGFDDNYTSERAGFIVSQFEFAHCAQTSADHAMANFVCDANKLLDMQNHGNSAVNCPFVIVLSDGRFNKENVRRYIREAKEKRYLFIFIVLDKPKTLENGKTESGIMSLRSAVKNEQGSIKLVPYLKDFPFDYYCIVQDTQQLPNALGTILIQWYQMVAAGGSQK